MAGIKIDPAPATALRKMVEEAERPSVKISLETGSSSQKN